MGYLANNDGDIIGKTNAATDMDIYFQTPTVEASKDIRDDMNVFLTSAEDKEEEPVTNTISGMRIVEDVDVSDLGDMLSAINNANAGFAKQNEEKALKQAEEEERLREEEIKRRQEEILKRKSEEEAKQREQLRLEEEARLREEEEAKGNKSKKQDNVISSSVKDAVGNIKKPTFNNPLEGLGDIELPKREKINIEKEPKPEKIKPEKPIKEKREKPVKEKPVKEKKEKIVKEKPVKEKVVKEKPVKEKKEEPTINIAIPNISFSRPKKDKEEPKNTINTGSDIDWKAKAITDSLTQTKNLTAYEEDSKNFSLTDTYIFIDINDLKIINDTYGHNTGDTVLIRVSQVLKKLFNNQTYRIGGDEFVILTDDNKNAVEKKIANLKKSLDKLTKSDKSGVIYSCAIGVAYGDGMKSLEELKSIADENMYASKTEYKEEHSKTEIVEKKEVETPQLDENGVDWKSLAMIDQKTKLKNKLALSMVDIKKTNVIALVRICNFSSFKREEGDRQIELIGELIKQNIGKTDNAYFIDNGTFVIVYNNQKKTGLDQIKMKARQLSLNTEMTTLTGNTMKIEEIIDIMVKKLDSKGVEEPKTYDEKLSVSQRKLKNLVRDNHMSVQDEDFEQALMQIQRKANDIVAVFLTDKSFNYLFIFFDVFDFLDKIYELQGNIDFSYIYAMYPGGALYYGSDEYTKEVNELFQKIADGLQSNTAISNKDIQKIDGINIFEKVFIA